MARKLFAAGCWVLIALGLAGIYGIMAAVAFRYWFPAPLVFLVAAFLCYAAAVATAPGRPSTGA